MNYLGCVRNKCSRLRSRKAGNAVSHLHYLHRILPSEKPSSEGMYPCCPTYPKSYIICSCSEFVTTTLTYVYNVYNDFDVSH